MPLQAVIKDLLTWGVDKVADRFNGQHALRQALARRDLALFQKALDQGIDVRAEDGKILADAVAVGSLEFVDCLLAYDPEIPKGRGLIAAAGHGEAKIAVRLIDAGADVHYHGDVSLESAIRGEHGDMIRLLAERGADIHEMGSLPLRNAIRDGHEVPVRILLELGARLKPFDAQELIVENLRAGIEAIPCLLWEYDQCPLAAFGKVLQEAAENGHTTMVRKVLPHVKPKLDTLIKAAEAGHDEIAALITAAGADQGGTFAFHRVSLRLKAMEYDCLPPEARQAALLVDGNATKDLRVIVAGGALDQMFSPASWQRPRAHDHARALHAAILEALPEYRSKIEAVDLTFLRTAETPPQADFVTRITPPVDLVNRAR